MTDLNPQAQQMADESMVRNLDAQARAIWPQEVELVRRYKLPPDARILDAGCGTGEASSRLAELFPKASVLGIDIIDAHLDLARKRYATLAPRLSFEHQTIFGLNAADKTFDLTVCRHVLHSIPHADQVIAELVRVTRPGGRVVASLFAAPERSEGTVVHEAMSALIPPERAADHAPYALSAPGNLEAALADVGLQVTDQGEVVCHWRYASMDEAVRALLCSAGGARAVQAAGPTAVREVLQRALAQFQDPETGVVCLANTFRWVAAS